MEYCELEYVHARRVIHRDLKTKNIFLTRDLTIKLGDFGISRVLEHNDPSAMTVVGTPYYMSPELCQSHPYTNKSDVWALGIIIYELTSLKHPFKCVNILGMAMEVVNTKHPRISTAQYSEDLADLIDKLLEKDPNNRPSARDLLKMELV